MFIFRGVTVFNIKDSANRTLRRGEGHFDVIWRCFIGTCQWSCLTQRVCIFAQWPHCRSNRLSQTHNKQISVFVVEILSPDISWMLLPLEIFFNVWCTIWCQWGHQGKRWNLSWFFPRKAGIQLQHSNVDGTSWSKLGYIGGGNSKIFGILPLYTWEMIKFDDHIVLRWVVQPPTSRFFLCRLLCWLSLESVLVHWNPLKAPFSHKSQVPWVLRLCWWDTEPKRWFVQNITPEVPSLKLQFAPENRPAPTKEAIVFQPSIFRGYVMLVSGRVSTQ